MWCECVRLKAQIFAGVGGILHDISGYDRRRHLIVGKARGLPSIQPLGEGEKDCLEL